MRWRRGWVLFKYNNTYVWGQQLPSDKLRLYMDVTREEGAAMAKREGTKRQQLARSKFLARSARRGSRRRRRRRRRIPGCTILSFASSLSAV